MVKKMKVKTESILPAPSDQRIVEFESDCRIALPEEFKQFIKEYNGAVPITNQFSDGRGERMIERFLCLVDDFESDVNGWYDIEVVLTQIESRLLDDEDLIGYNVIPFAALFAGDFVCLDCRKSGISPVVVWYHEESDDLSPVFATVATNFTEFLEMLKE